MGGSMGSAVGEKVTRAVERSLDEAIPLVVISCSGGARMQEGALSLMQMAKISAALGKLHEARLPFVSILTDPTTGGVTASYAMLGDLNIAEPKALIGFAGPRVIEQTIREKLPEGFQRSEFLLEHGMLDFIVERRQMREVLIQCLRVIYNRDLVSAGVQKSGGPSDAVGRREPQGDAPVEEAPRRTVPFPTSIAAEVFAICISEKIPSCMRAPPEDEKTIAGHFRS